MTDINQNRGTPPDLSSLDNIPQGSVICVVGARPNFTKIVPIMRAFRESSNEVSVCLVHTGQHYDDDMKESFFRQLNIPEPDIDLGVGSGSHSVQTAEIMVRFEPVVDILKPSAVLVVGDVNSTIACTLVAAKKLIPVVHVEAGLRSYDREMPEEVNRVLTDQLADLLFTTEKSAEDNLVREGISKKRIHFVGNVMIDTLLSHKPKAIPYTQTLEKYDVPSENISSMKDYAALTLHRPSNVDDAKILGSLVNVLHEISEKLPIIFPVHPRTLSNLESSGLIDSLKENPQIHLLPPISYLEMLGMVVDSRMVLTDSGGLQEETTALGVPCITLRENTERPITVDQGTNTIVGTDPEKILASVDEILSTGGKAGCIPELWDGKAAVRICEIIFNDLVR